MKTPTVETLRAMNAAFYLPPVPHIERHIAEMRELAASKPHECGRIVDWRTGETLWNSSESDADANTVDMTAARPFCAGNLMLHTHPSAAELSLPDFLCCAWSGARVNCAVSPDGTISWSAGYDPHMPEEFAHWAADEARHAYGFQGFEWDSAGHPDPRQAALDNYWLAKALFDNGLALGQQHNFYSDAVIALMTGTE